MLHDSPMEYPNFPRSRTGDASVRWSGVVRTQSRCALAEAWEQELPSLENHWLQVQDDPDALEFVLPPEFLRVARCGGQCRRCAQLLEQNRSPPARSERPIPLTLIGQRLTGASALW
jgi:hypothetical protein